MNLVQCVWLEHRVQKSIPEGLVGTRSLWGWGFKLHPEKSRQDRPPAPSGSGNGAL